MPTIQNGTYSDAAAYVLATNFLSPNPHPHPIFPLDIVAEFQFVQKGNISKKKSAGTLPTIRIGNVEYVSAEIFKKDITDIRNLETVFKNSASIGQKITYANAMGALNLKMSPLDHLKIGNPHHRRRIGFLAGNVSRLSFDEHEILLSAILVEKHTDLPSMNGFMSLAHALNIENPYNTPEEFAQYQQKLVFDTLQIHI